MANDYFALFGFAPQIEIDMDELNRKYLALQAQFHPDKTGGSMEKSAEINKAYGVLKNRFKRAEYLLGELQADPETLMEIMELRENQTDETVTDVNKQVEKLFAEMTVEYGAGRRDVAAKKFVKIKYLNKFLEDVAANS